MTRSAGESAVRGYERRLKSFCKRHVQGIVRRQIVPERPCSGEQWLMRVPHDTECPQIAQSLLGTFGRQRASLLKPSEHLGDLDIEQVWRMKHLPRSKKEICKSLVRLAPQKKLHRGRRVDDDQRPALTARTASAELSPTKTRALRSRRSRISSGVGRAAASRNSPRR